MGRQSLWGTILLLGLLALVGLGMWKTGGRNAPPQVLMPRRIEGVMGTDATLAVVLHPNDRLLGADALQEAEQSLRDAEAELSTWIHRSELGRLNRAKATVEVPLSAHARQLLQTARRAHRETGGVFDITCRPVIELWRTAGQRKQLPTDDQIAAAQNESNWGTFELTDRGAKKRKPTARVDLGGIAKGYAIDQALGVLSRSGIAGGLVNIGGDLACFGHPPAGEAWEVDVQHPFRDGPFGTLQIAGGAVCTSGNYRRFTEIDGRRYSHIIDPRTGRPAEQTASVTVLADSALTADIWATALSILGTDGFGRLPAGVEAMVIEGDRDDYRVHATGVFWQQLQRNSR